MLSLTSKLTLESKVLPGVTVHLRKFNVERRAAITLQLAEYRSRLSDLYRRMLEHVIVEDETDENGAVTKAGDPADVRERKTIERVKINMEIEALEDSYLKAATLRVYVTAVDGLEIDGRAAVPEDVVTLAPPEFADEIYQFIQANNGIGPFGSSGSESPSLSPAPVDGTSQNTIATDAAN